ncbi:NAD(P)/FAD-dependent oxidoreductase [Nodosilinea sp. LEGE 06152]|uniref:FAD-dependent oxidoreductase n=1 Tax=Nodosilinea sp. LEGE 06152 TaxID=2777966 RepID=UPI00187E7E1C|nr:FAD-dependent oxidoreductase [Nodosilinea sp. LEGE 06152]MBE9158021.1 NAD(P)/FAD-dependent oxidoreductase [Nodosilinea sp. LEGE 06152]
MAVDYDAVILGGTVQGREAAALAAREGARVALVEPLGSVDGLIRRQLILTAMAAAPGTDWHRLQHQVRALEAVAYPHLSLDRLATGGVDVVLEPGQFSPRPRLAVTTLARRLTSRGYLLAPGTEVTVPDIPGLAETPHFTLDSLLELETQPKTAIVLGRSGAAIALAQALARHGTRTTLVSRGEVLLPTEDADLSAFVSVLLEAAGVTLRLGTQIETIRQKDDVELLLSDGGAIAAQVLVLATAPHPLLETLNLASIGICPRTVHGNTTALPVDDRLATAHPRVFACGPAVGGYWAETTDHQDVAIALRNLLYLPWRKLSFRDRPALLHTTPEYARLGLTATQAHRWYGSEAAVLQVPFGQLLKAHHGDDITGFCRWVVRGNGQLIGAQICGPGASELIHTLALAMQQGIALPQLERLPTLPHSLAAILPSMVSAWQQQRWHPGTWRRDWAENWFNWRRSR